MQSVPPCQEYGARTAVTQCGQRKVAKCFFDARDQWDITSSSTIGEQAKIFAGLILLEQGQKCTPSAVLPFWAIASLYDWDKVRCTRLSLQCWSSLPSPIVGLEAAVREALALAVESPSA